MRMFFGLAGIFFYMFFACLPWQGRARPFKFAALIGLVVSLIGLMVSALLEGIA